MKSKIKIKNNSSGCVIIDIEGVIGVSEKGQFDQSESKVATYEKFKVQSEKIRKIAAKEVIVNIRSAGGSVNDALLIYDSLLGLDARITTNCFGYVASAATIIAQAASPERRLVSSNSLYLIHNSTSNCDGNASEILQTVELLKATDSIIANVYAARSGRDAGIFSALMSENGGNGRWLSAEECVDYSLADAVVEAPPTKNMSNKMLSLLGLPSLPPLNNKQSLTDKLQQKWREIVGMLEAMPSDEPEELDESGNQEGSERLADVADEAGVEPAESNVLEAAEVSIDSENLDAECSSDELLDLDIPQNIVENAIQRLEMEHRALPTTTMPVEDPSLEETKPRANQFAYGEDVKQFR